MHSGVVTGHFTEELGFEWNPADAQILVRGKNLSGVSKPSFEQKKKQRAEVRQVCLRGCSQGLAQPKKKVSVGEKWGIVLDRHTGSKWQHALAKQFELYPRNNRKSVNYSIRTHDMFKQHIMRMTWTLVSITVHNVQREEPQIQSVWEAQGVVSTCKMVFPRFNPIPSPFLFQHFDGFL